MKIEWRAAALCIARIAPTPVPPPFSSIMARRRRWLAAMRPVLEKLFGSGQEPENAGQCTIIRPGSASEPASPSGGEELRQTRDEDSKSENISHIFDSIGRRNETLRAQLDSIEFSFRNIEAIRTQFHDALTSIDQTLIEIERTKVAHLAAERKLENLTAANDRLRSDRAALTVQRDAMAIAQDELLARVADLERMVTAGEAAASEARFALAERSATLEQTEQDLEDNRRVLHALSEQLPALRAELVTKENCLHEVEGQRATLNDHCGLLTQENDTLRMRIQEFAINSSKLGRHLSELKDQRDELQRRLDKVETAFDQETAAHATLKAAHLDVIEAQRLSEANLQEKLAATTTRLEAAEQLLVEARAGMHEQDATIRELEQSVLEKSVATKSLEAQIVDLEKDLTSSRAGHVEKEAARTAAAGESATLAKSLKEKEVTLQRAELKIATLEARFEEYKNATLGDRVTLDEKIARLMEQLEAETAARQFAEGALQSARQERSARRQEIDLVPSSTEAPSGKTDSADGRITWLGR
jgi:chromosome segregation ATPase